MQEKLNNIIIKALSGEISLKERNFLDAWISEDENNREEFEWLQKTWKSNLPYPKIANAEEEFDRLWKRIHPAEYRRSIYGNHYNWSMISKIAAGFLVLLSVMFLIHFNSNRTESVPEDVNITKSTSKGQKSRIFLKDGTQVWVNASSSIEYPETYENLNQRTLILKGEAYFQVARDEHKPFKILCGGIIVEVLGTAFNVDASNDDRIDIALTEGLVKVQRQGMDGNPVVQILEPGQMMSIDLVKRKANITPFNPKVVNGWKDGILYFEDASFDEVIERLSNWYGVEFEVKGSPGSAWAYGGEFDNFVLKNLLEAMSFSEKFDYKIEGDKVQIMFN